jgi:hypothetical protein
VSNPCHAGDRGGFGGAQELFGGLIGGDEVACRQDRHDSLGEAFSQRIEELVSGPVGQRGVEGGDEHSLAAGAQFAPVGGDQLRGRRRGEQIVEPLLVELTGQR